MQLTLSQQQQVQIKEIVRDYDTDLALVWKQFGERYMEATRTEALLLTAIEDHLTERTNYVMTVESANDPGRAIEHAAGLSAGW